MVDFMENYRPLKKDVWQGRVDDPEDKDSFRWHQVVKPIDLSNPAGKIMAIFPEAAQKKKQPQGIGPENRGFCFLGFCCDEGVKRNPGRAGAARAPIMIRREMSNFPHIFPGGTGIYDAGDIHCTDKNLELAQAALSGVVQKIVSLNLFPVLLGGGHEIAYGHFKGIKEAMSKIPGMEDRQIGIVNFDAHFDLRPYDKGANSGTIFLQIADLCRAENRKFSYFCLGIHKYCNTLRLFKTADQLGVRYIMAKDMGEENTAENLGQLDDFLQNQDMVYLTICADVFSSAYAPGVSSPQPFGLFPETVLIYLKHVIRSGKVIGFDIAEVSPRFDEDNRTARLAAIVIFALINTMLSQ
ncbi:MAG: formimidoylglutamase [Candidatus Aminicenantes bacterium]|nr:formimidoylglutamase [Candidatus Aminicenantes bacterium]